MTFLSQTILSALNRLGFYVTTLKFAEETFADSYRRTHIIYRYREMLRASYTDLSSEGQTLDFIKFCFEHDENSCSQMQQDLWVLFMLNLKTVGFFVEFGAADGLEHSNTYTLEKNFGWNGILIEPVPEYFKKLDRHRNVNKYHGCVAIDDQDQYELVVPEYGQLSSIEGCHNTDLHTESRTRNSHKISATAYDLNQLLTKHAPPDGIIDYLSIDVEGVEQAILKRIDFENWQFRAITVEHNSRPADMEFLTTFFEQKGYQMFPNQLFTDIEYWFWKPELCSPQKAKHS